MISVNLESILVNKFMEEQNLTMEEAKDLSQVSTIHYGLNKHHSLLYLVKISDASKKIGKLRKKIIYDEMKTHQYEREMWQLYREVTMLKKEYYNIKHQNWEPLILNAYVTFRDIQARNKALEIFSQSPIKKYLGKSFYPESMKLLGTGIYNVSPAMDPETILWENLGTPPRTKFLRAISTLAFCISVFAVSFIGIWGIQLFEKMQVSWVRSDTCDDIFTLDSAFNDHLLPFSL